VQLYLVFADRENAGPGTLRLGTLIDEMVTAECAAHGYNKPTRRRSA
jgi:hypothetical protein